ncbi:MAG: ADP-ribosylglycohydrolase family protein, partial [Agathobacter sp.]|nr:ADP-ribosylglycohydrolase family protein [Agathobacter sp.]
DLNRTLADIRPTYHHVESCQQTVPEAVIAFLEAESFEDAVRNAVSLGGDTDTLAAITGSIAEAYFGIPAALKAECRDRISDEMLEVVEAFDEVRDAALGRNEMQADERTAGNETAD